MRSPQNSKKPDSKVRETSLKRIMSSFLLGSSKISIKKWINLKLNSFGLKSWIRSDWFWIEIQNFLRIGSEWFGNKFQNGSIFHILNFFPKQKGIFGMEVNPTEIKPFQNMFLNYSESFRINPKNIWYLVWCKSVENLSFSIGFNARLQFE